ncbi:MAG: monofunctional biosynthetic peptidoglycan transglycosylase [Candidatus Eisenbacteria bacterium]
MSRPKRRKKRGARGEERRSRRRVFLAAVGLAVAATFLSPIGYVTLFGPDVRGLRDGIPLLTALQRERSEAAIESGRPFRKEQQWVPYERISPHLVNAVIVSEDATFWTHSGFDFHEIRESINKNWKERRYARGASTITQQLAKNLYFGAERSLRRKFLEAFTAWRIERNLSKKRILEIYLNVIEWGPGVYGADAASHRYFGVGAGDLTPRQAALLASAIPSPLKMNPGEPGPFLQERAAMTLERMKARGML